MIASHPGARSTAACPAIDVANETNPSGRLRRWLVGGAITAAAGLLILALLSVTAPTPVADAQTGGSTLGQWSAVQNWPVAATHAHLLPTGKVLFHPAWDGGDNPNLWDPATNATSQAALAGYDIFCSGGTFLSNGQLFVAGGHTVGLSTTGLPYASTYDPVTNSWTRLPDMNLGRWYPTTTTLANGDVVVLAGTYDDAGDVNPLPQVWQTGSSSWRNLTSANLNLPWYPRTYLAPNGMVFDAGPDQTSRYLDTTGTGAWTTAANRNFADRTYGPSVMYDTGKILYAGGGDPPTATAELIDLTSPSPTWQYTASMGSPRRQNNATLLPDGKVLVTGGSSGAGFDNSSYPVYAAEIWDPASGTWTTLASNTIYRGYHSTALLLPDGRVVSAGGEVGGATAEVYSPPYLFRGTRPSITSAPSGVGYGQMFFVATPDATSITQVTWIRLGSVTHAFDENQRINRLTFTQAAGGLTVTAPSDPNLTPPGHYMLFILNGSGVPSVASIVHIDTPVGLPTAPSGLKANAPGSKNNLRVNLTWTNTASNATGISIERSLDGTTFGQIATVGPSVSSYTDTQLKSATTYYYRARAYNNSGYSAYSNRVSAKTP